MIEAQKYKFAPLLAPISIAGGASATSLIVDTLGFSYADVFAFFGLIGASGVNVLKVQEDVLADGSTATDITGADFGGLPVTGDAGGAFSTKIPLGAGRKRYLKLVLTKGADNVALCSAFVLLHRADEVPNTAAERGLVDEAIMS